MDALVRSLFLSGSYGACTSKDSEGLSLRSLGYIARAYLADNDVTGARQTLVDNNIDKNSVLWILLDIVENGPSEEIAEKARESKDDNNNENIPVIGTVLFLCGHADEAVRVLESGLNVSTQGENGEELSAEQEEIQHENKEECLYICISVLLAMHRHDLASSIYKKYAGDSICMQQCEAWLALVEGGHRTQSSFYAFDELLNMPGARSHLSLNGRACARAVQGDYHEATIDLDSATQLSTPCSHTLANHAVLALLQSNKPDSYLNKLSTLAPSHPLLSEYSAQEKLFDDAAAEFGPSVVV